MRNATGNPNLKIPANPVYIDFPRSDGDPRTWPTNIQYVVDNEGQVNWMKELDIDHPIATKWRLVVGKALALDMGREPADSAVLRNWPTNYKMYDHHKGPASGNIRHDIYLYGPQSRRFRSPNEFVPHALWLCRDTTMDTKNCFCKYCKKVPQKVISSALDSIIQTPSQAAMSPTPSQNFTNATAGPSTSPQVSTAGRDIYSALQNSAWARQVKDRDATSLAQRRAKREKRLQNKGKGKYAEGAEVPKVFAIVQKPVIAVSALKPSQNILEYPMLAQRNRDLRAIYTRSANHKDGNTSREDTASHGRPGESQENPAIRRWFRDHEVVWARLPGDGIVLQPGSPHRITEWPAVIDEFKVKNTPVHIDPTQTAGSSQLQGKQPELLSVDRQTTLNVGSPSNPNSQPLAAPTSPFSTQSSTSLATASGLPPPFSSAVSNASSSSIPPTPTNGNLSSAFPSAAPTGGRPSPALPSAPKSPNATATTESDRAGSADWIVKESTVYTVRLIGTNQKVNFADRDVLPYLATVPSEELINLLREVPVQYMDFNRDKISEYDAIAASKGHNDRMDEGSNQDQRAMYEGACAFAFALQIAANVCEFWSLTDRWEFKYVPPGYVTRDVRVNVVSSPASNAIPQGGKFLPQVQQQQHQPESISGTSVFRVAPYPPVTAVQTTTFTGGLSLSQAIEQAGRHNAGLGAASAASEARAPETGPVYREVSTISNNMSDQQVKETVAGVLGIGPNTLKTPVSSPGPGSASAKTSPAHDRGRPVVSQYYTQVRFQGMWWGGERIWVDDFVRLKFGRKAVAPNGAPNVYKASGDGKRAAAFRVEARQRAMAQRGSSGGPDLSANGKGKGREYDLSFLPELPEGANRRSLFMKVNAIFMVDVRKKDGGVKKEVRVSGILYELADEDWEETEPDLLEEYEKDKQQKDEVLQRRKNAPSSFQASVDESLLPSTKPATPAKSPSVQSSPPDHYLAPQPPQHYRFRRIIKAGYEVVLNVTFISGRYYPRLLSHPLIADMVAGYEEDWKSVSYKSGNPFALEGLHPGHCSAVDPVVYKMSRVRMFESADLQVQEQMAAFKRDRIAAEAANNSAAQHDVAMDQDGDERSDELRLEPNFMAVD